MTTVTPLLSLFFVILVALVKETSLSQTNKEQYIESCGCYYDVYANMDKMERKKTACAKNCVYRTIDGSCNNRCNPDKYGVALEPYGRLLKPEYCKTVGLEALRCAYDGSPLTSARVLSVEFFQDKPPRDMDKFVTMAHMVFGQFLSHDFARTNEPLMKDKHDRDLCGKDQCNENKVCFPIQVFLGDPAFPPTQCLKFHRTTRRPTHLHECRDQQNDVSSFIDLNPVYGSTYGELMILRDARPEYSAYLNMTSMSVLNLGPNVKKGKDLLPQMDGGKCRGQTDVIKCFMAGDRRVVEQVQLSLLHTLFAREHNRIVAQLDEVNDGCWSQERLFDEARKINIAQFQMITYNEYVKVMFSEQALKHWGLNLQHGNYFYGYDKKINATVTNVFQNSAFRFGHSQIPPELSLARNDFYIYKTVPFSGVFHNPTLIYDPMDSSVTGADALAFGIVAASAEFPDNFFNKQLTRSFDADKVQGLGRDLEAIDINRGRDHGLPGYNSWRRWCGLSYAVRSFDEFEDIPPNLRAKLSMYYKSVEDVDLFLAAMLETLEPGALVGPTFTCLNGEQFMRSKFGDRFWFENPLAGFTKAQLKSLSHITFAKILCNNLDDAVSMPPNIMVHPRSRAESLAADSTSHWPIDFVYRVKLGHDNEPVSCSSLYGTDLSQWKEKGCWHPKCSKTPHRPVH